jgi:hypothetical protein
MLSDRITEDADWRDGINAFRQYAHREINKLKEEIKLLKKQLNKENINGTIPHKDIIRNSGGEGLLRGSGNSGQSTEGF